MKKFKFSGFMLIAGLVFIYLPMLILVIYSFNFTFSDGVGRLVDQVV